MFVHLMFCNFEQERQYRKQTLTITRFKENQVSGHIPLYGWTAVNGQ